MSDKFKLSEASLKNLYGVHSDLVDIVKYAIRITEIDFKVIEGLRSVTRQKELFNAGKSKTMNSRHLTGHAVDLAAIVDGKINWDFENYKKIAVAMKKSAEALGYQIEWGGDWKTFRDGPHFELSRKVYK